MPGPSSWILHAHCTVCDNICLGYNLAVYRILLHESSWEDAFKTLSIGHMVYHHHFKRVCENIHGMCVQVRDHNNIYCSHWLDMWLTEGWRYSYLTTKSVLLSFVVLSSAESLTHSRAHIILYTLTHTDEYIRKLWEVYNASGIPFDQVLDDSAVELVSPT